MFIQVSQAYSSDNNLSTYEQQFGTNLYPGGDVANRQFTNPNRQQGIGGQRKLALLFCSSSVHFFLLF